MLLAGYVTPSYVEKTLKGPQQHSEIEALPAMANPCKRRIAKPSKFIIIELSWDPILGAFQNGRQNTKTLVDKSLSGIFDIFRLVFIGGNQRK